MAVNVFKRRMFLKVFNRGRCLRLSSRNIELQTKGFDVLQIVQMFQILRSTVGKQNSLECSPRYRIYKWSLVTGFIRSIIVATKKVITAIGVRICKAFWRVISMRETKDWGLNTNSVKYSFIVDTSIPFFVHRRSSRYSAGCANTSEY